MQLSECPDITVWRTFLAGVVPAADRTACEAHLARCRTCRERLIALNDEANEARIQESGPVSLKSRVTQSTPIRSSSVYFINAWRPYVPLALAATVVLAVGLSIFVYRTKDRNPQNPDGSGIRQSNNATRELALVNPPNGAELNSSKLQFRWSDAGGDARYDFTLTDETGDIIHQEKLTTTSLVLDPATLQLSAQKKYYWSVMARLSDGTSRESVVARFTLR